MLKLTEYAHGIKICLLKLFEPSFFVFYQHSWHLKVLHIVCKKTTINKSTFLLPFFSVICVYRARWGGNNAINDHQYLYAIFEKKYQNKYKTFKLLPKW